MQKLNLQEESDFIQSKQMIHNHNLFKSKNALSFRTYTLSDMLPGMSIYPFLNL
jgi:hypothetical protein